MAGTKVGAVVMVSRAPVLGVSPGLGRLDMGEGGTDRK